MLDVLRVLLVQPPITSTWSLPPLGIACIASVLREQDYEVQIMDCNLEKDQPLKQLVSKAKAFHPDVLGMTCWGDMAPFCIEFCKRFKENSSETLVVLGGELASYVAPNLLKTCPIDVIVRGEGEETIVELLRKTKMGEELPKVSGITYRREERTISTDRRPLIPALDKLPIPAWDLFQNLSAYSGYTKEKCLPMQGSRGCPFNCIFCSVTKMWGSIQRRKSPKAVIMEIRYLMDQFGVEKLYFCDDTFTLNHHWVKEICELLVSENLGVTWSISTRADLVNDDLLRAMRKAGCEKIFYGVESVSKRILKFMRKNISPQQTRKALIKTLKAEILPEVSVIFGFPIEKEEDIERNADFCVEIAKMGVAHLHQHVLFPLSGTDIFNLYRDTIIRNPYPYVTQPSLSTLSHEYRSLLENYRSYVPDFWIFKHSNLTTKRFFELYIQARMRIIHHSLTRQRCLSSDVRQAA